MNNINDINDLEYRLWLLQGEVNSALLNTDRSDLADLTRLNHMESEICYLQQQVAGLKAGRWETSLAPGREQTPAFHTMSSVQPQSMSGPTPYVQPQPMPGPTPYVQPQSMPGSNPFVRQQSTADPTPYMQPQSTPGSNPFVRQQSTAGPTPYMQPQSTAGPNPFAQQPLSGLSSAGDPKKKDLEKVLGTGIMGIVASVLIFISIIIFGGLLLPYLTDVIMTAVMFLLSFILFGTGCGLLRKDPANKFHISLCACGATAICVSLFVTRLYFALINDSVFLVLIAAWLALMIYICRKYRNRIFRIIGEIGIFLTMCLGTARLTADNMTAGSWFMFCILLLVFGCSALIFDRIIPAESYEKNAFPHCIRTLVFLLLCIIFAGKTGSGIGVYAGFGFVTAFLVMEVCLSYRDTLHDGCLFYCLMSINGLLYCAILCGTFHTESYLPYYITAILLAGLFEVKQSKNSLFGNCIVCLFFLWSGWAWLHTGIFYTVLVMLPLFACGYVKKNAVPLYIGLFSILAVFTADITVLSMVFLWAVPFVCFVILARRMKDQIFTAAGYPLFMICGMAVWVKLLSGFDYSADETMMIVFLILTVLHILLIKLRAFAEERPGFEIVAAVMTICLMLFGSYAVYQEYLNLFTMLATVLLYTMNTANLLKRSEKFGYYIGWKCTVLMILLVDAHFELSMLVSVLMLLFAAGSIAFGFYGNYKSFRIYGLILSMISVFKLILYDVSGKSALYNAVGFLVCGLICFGISFLYNKIESKVKKNNKEE